MADANTPPRSPELTANGAALLGLLGITAWPRPWTTYELAKQAKRSVHWVWPRAERLLYDIPKKLVEQGYAVADPASTGNRRSVQYRITEAGRDAMSDWLDSEGPPPTFDVEQLIRVFYGEQGTVDQLRRNIDRIGDQAATARRQLAEVVAGIEESGIARRSAVNALSVRLVTDLNRTIEDWADWARTAVADWDRPDADWPDVDWPEAAAIFADVAGARPPH